MGFNQNDMTYHSRRVRPIRLYSPYIHHTPSGRVCTTNLHPGTETHLQHNRLLAEQRETYRCANVI